MKKEYNFSKGTRGKFTPTRHWLMKSEPGCYSIDDLKRDKKTA